MRVLDIGCGAHYRGSVNVDVDLSTIKHHPNYALTREAAKHIPNFVLADGCHLPFKENVFDKVFSFHVIEHVQNPELFLKELLRVTKNYGQVRIRCPYKYWRSYRLFAKSPEQHVSYLSPGWFKKALRGHLLGIELDFRPLVPLLFLSFPHEIKVNVMKMPKVS